MSNMKTGFSTLNRWWGKKQKADKSTPNGKLSKSSNNLSLSVSTTNINDASQVEYNRITPLPTATSNAPFEQTFRITVLLPKDQLYVARLGALVPLSKLLELVCENKLLDKTKFEFRNPVDPSQVYSCDLTIGAVGLSEVRLCHKSESYDSFNTDEIVKLHRTQVIRDSLSSSEFSSRYSKHTTKTTSPYSSSNSLNSMDSTGMNCVRTPVSPPPTLPPTPNPMKIAAPPRKKRTAPRPPSQTVILEKSALGNEEQDNEQSTNENGTSKTNSAILRNQNFVSTPNLATTTNSSTIDCNGNATNQNGHHNQNDTDTISFESETSEEQSQVQAKNARNIIEGSVTPVSSPTLQQAPEFPEPSPRKRLVQIKKKSAPAPPPRGSSYMDDSVSVKSMTPSSPNSPLTTDQTFAYMTTTRTATTYSNEQLESPKPNMRDESSDTSPLHSSTPVLETNTSISTDSISNHTQPEKVSSPPKPVPRVTTTTVVHEDQTESNVPESVATAQHSNVSNVSKTILNRTPTPEPRSLSSEPPECDSGCGAHLSDLKSGITTLDDDTISKQADSGIGEPVPSPIPDSLPSEGSTHECKSTFESSSDDDDMVKVYNFKLGKTLTKTTPEPKSLTDFAKLADAQTDSENNTPGIITQETTPNFSDSASWNFSIPISPPPNFADTRFMEKLQNEKPPDTPITPKIKERPLLNFDSLKTDSTTLSRDETDRCLIVDKEKVEEKRSNMNQVHPIAKTPATPLPSPTTPLNDIVDELSAIINDNRMDTLIKKVENHGEIEAAKPNTLTNFSITTISQQTTKPITTNTESSGNSIGEDKTAQSLLRSTIVRSDSLNSKPISSTDESTIPVKLDHSLNSRSSSQTSLTKLEQNDANLNRRRSSSELSIGESPSLQSLEVIKTILNSRKNSLEKNSDSESKSKPIAESSKYNEERSLVENTEITPKNTFYIEKSAPISEKAKPKDTPKVYRYSGPPSINFSTWNERPKVQVSIKNEGDYIFGGKNADSQSAAVTTAALEINRPITIRNNRVSMPVNALRKELLEQSNESTIMASTPPATAPKPPSPTKRMGIPEQDFQVPITVRPLRDVTPEAKVESRAFPVDDYSIQQQQTVTAKTIKTTNVTKLVLNSDGAITTNNPNTDTLPKRASAQASTHTSTLPRSGTNRYTVPANMALGPTLLRSTSITQLEASKPKTGPSETVAAPFGQNTLRKTGLKEKILAKEAEEQQKGNISQTSTPSSPKIITSTVANGYSNFANSNANANASTNKPIRTLQSAKMEVKLQRPTNIYVHQINHTNASISPTPPTPKSASTVPTPPALPAPAKITASVRTPKNSAATTPTSPDPHDQLLAAIRNFKRDELNRI